MIDHEHQDAKALIKWRDYHLGKYPCLKNLIHIPNGGLRNLKVAKKLKAEGVKPGVSDYLLPTASHSYMSVTMFAEPIIIKYNGLWIELKAGKNTPTDSQTEWLWAMREQGYAAYWCVGWEEAVAIIIAYLECKPPVGRNPKPLKET